jgi:hypothetical protein
MTAADLDILLVSSFSRDYVFVAAPYVAQAMQILQQIGFVKRQYQNCMAYGTVK